MPFLIFDFFIWNLFSFQSSKAWIWIWILLHQKAWIRNDSINENGSEIIVAETEGHKDDNNTMKPSYMGILPQQLFFDTVPDRSSWDHSLVDAILRVFAVLWIRIRIRIGFGFNRVPGSVSGSGSNKHRKINFIFLSAGCSVLRAASPVAWK
jgi:hypothetical protein